MVLRNDVILFSRILYDIDIECIFESILKYDFPNEIQFIFQKEIDIGKLSVNDKWQHHNKSKVESKEKCFRRVLIHT